MIYSNARHQILSILDTTVKSLVTLPDYASVDLEVADGVTSYKIDIHRDDRSEFLGRAGANLRALRTLADSIAQKSDIQVALVLCE